IVLVRKIGAPYQPELALGAIVEGNPVQRFINRDIVAELGVPQSYIEDDVVCLYAPSDFGAIGFFYRDFHQLDDKTVTALLTAAAKRQGGLAAKSNHRSHRG